MFCLLEAKKTKHRRLLFSHNTRPLIEAYLCVTCASYLPKNELTLDKGLEILFDLPQRTQAIHSILEGTEPSIEKRGVKSSPNCTAAPAKAGTRRVVIRHTQPSSLDRTDHKHCLNGCNCCSRRQERPQVPLKVGQRPLALPRPSHSLRQPLQPQQPPTAANTQ